MNKIKLKEWWQKQVASLRKIKNPFSGFREWLRRQLSTAKVATVGILKKTIEDAEEDEAKTLYIALTLIGLLLPSVAVFVLTVITWATPFGTFVIIDAQVHWLLLFICIILPFFVLSRSLIVIPAKDIGGFFFFEIPLITFYGGIKVKVWLIQAIHEPNTNMLFQFKKGDLNWGMLTGSITSSLKKLSSDEFSEDERTALQKGGKDAESGLHKATTVKPNVSITIKKVKSEYFYYLKNIDGDTPEQRFEWIEKQLRAHAESCLNTVLKQYTHAMLLIVMRTKIIDEALQQKLECLIDDKKEISDNAGPNRLGLNCINAEVTQLNAGTELHAAIDGLISETQHKQKVITKAEGLAKEIELLGTAKNLVDKGAGETQANTLKLLLKEAENAEVDRGFIMELEAQMEMAKHAKHTYITSMGKKGTKDSEEALSPGLIAIVDKITTALENLKQGVGVNEEGTKNNKSNKGGKK